MAKLHVRHMIAACRAGSRTRFCTVSSFLSDLELSTVSRSMSESWNISLFHYRNHGTDAGRVLIGMQVPERDRGELARFLSELGYAYRDETDNEAYRLFLA